VRALLLLVLVATSACAETYTYWIEPCNREETQCDATDTQLAEWAMDAWQRGSDGGLTFTKSPLSKARIRIFWAASGNQGLYGEARAIEVEGKSGAELNIRCDLKALGKKIAEQGARDRLYRDTVIYLTILHEMGHAIGLPHTRSFTDIMYSFEYGGNITEYFGRYRRRLKKREDIPLNSGLSAEDDRRLASLYRGK